MLHPLSTLHSLPAERLVADRLELVAGAPLGHPRRIGDAIAHRQEELEILRAAGEVPARLDLVLRLVVVVRRILVALLFAKARRLADVLDARIRIERRDALLR